jgi:hypothetical protein
MASEVEPDDDRFSLSYLGQDVVPRYNMAGSYYYLNFKPKNFTPENYYEELADVLDKVVEHFTRDLDPEADRIAISFSHDDLQKGNIDVPFQRPSRMTGKSVFTHLGKIIQSEESIATDGRMTVTCYSDYSEGCARTRTTVGRECCKFPGLFTA